MKKLRLVSLSTLMLSMVLMCACSDKSNSGNSGQTNSPAIHATEEDVTVDAGTGFPLGGTLSIPQGAQTPYPCVVLVAGSGSSDRDETVNSNKPFKDIADYLSSQGIAVLRYDKRPYTYGEKMVNAVGASFTVEEEYIQDVVAASKLVKADPRIDANRVFILGHSEGGMLAPRIDAEGGDFAGVIIMAGSPRSLLDVSYDQGIALINATLTGDALTAALAQQEQQRAFIDSLPTMTDDEAKAVPMGGGVSAYYYKEMIDHPASDYLQKIKTPFLIMYGSSDIQISTADFQGYKDLLRDRNNVTFKEYSGLSHLFMPATKDDVVANMADPSKLYTTPGHVDPQVLADIAEWVKAN